MEDDPAFLGSLPRPIFSPPSGMIVQLVTHKFKDKIRDALNVAFAGLNFVMQDKRIAPFVKVLQENGQTLFVASERIPASTGPVEKLSLHNFESMFRKSFPPCMKWVVQAQREQKRRLKHQGKLQLRPFLKECGFTLADSITWWRVELTRDPEVDDTKFDKNHL